MKYEEFGAKTLWGAVKHQWKFILIVVIIFAMIGVGAGAAFADKGAGESAGQAEPIPLVDYSEIKMDYDYYSLCYTELSNSYKLAVAYQTDFVSKSNLTDQQSQDLTDILSRLKAFSGDLLNTLDRMFAAINTVYIPETYVDEYAEVCEMRLSASRHKLAVAQAAAEILASMDAPAFDSEKIIANYELLLATAATAPEQLRIVQLCEANLEALQDTAAVAQAEAEVKVLLADAADELNVLLAALNSTVDTIAKENDVIYSILPDAEKIAQFTMHHTHSSSSVQESFVLIVLFCTLSGICVGAFFAVCRECKKQKKSQAA